MIYRNVESASHSWFSVSHSSRINLRQNSCIFILKMQLYLMKCIWDLERSFIKSKWKHTKTHGQTNGIHSYLHIITIVNTNLYIQQKKYAFNKAMLLEQYPFLEPLFISTWGKKGVWKAVQIISSWSVEYTLYTVEVKLNWKMFITLVIITFAILIRL